MYKYPKKIHSDSRKNHAYMFVVSSVISILFVDIQIQQSIHHGVLSLPPTYDDIGYFNDALERLRHIYDRGFLGFSENYLKYPPHSPLYTILAMIGFSIFGYQPWSACALIFVLIMPMIYLLLYFTSRFSIYNHICLLSLMLASPIFSLMIIEFRPDAFCGLVTALGVVLILFSNDWSSGYIPTNVLVGFLLGIALIAKLTVAPITIVLFYSAMIYVLYVDRHKSHVILTSIIRTTALAIAISLPTYALSWYDIFEYIRTSLVDEASIWTPNLSFFENITYYIYGPGGMAGVGCLVILWPFLLVLTLVSIFSNNDTWFAIRSLGFLILFIIAYSIVTFAGIKSPFLGLIVPSFIAISILLMANYIINSLYGYNQIIIANIFCFGLFVVSIISWTTEYDSIIGNKSVHDQNNSIIQKAALEKIAAKLKADPIIGQRSLYFPIISPYVNENSFFFILLSSGYYSIKSTSSWRLTSLSDHEKRLREADYAIIFSDNSIEPMSWISSIKIRKQIREMVQSSSNFELIEVADLSGEGRLFLYKNRVIQ